MPTTRNMRKQGIVGKLKFCTFPQNCNGLVSWNLKMKSTLQGE